LCWCVYVSVFVCIDGHAEFTANKRISKPRSRVLADSCMPLCARILQTDFLVFSVWNLGLVRLT